MIATKPRHNDASFVAWVLVFCGGALVGHAVETNLSLLLAALGILSMFVGGFVLGVTAVPRKQK